MNRNVLIGTALSVGLLSMLAFTATQDTTSSTSDSTDDPSSWTGDSWPLETCVVSGRAMASPKIATYDEREVRFCCGGCRTKFESEPSKYLVPADQEIMKTYRQSYPLKTCIVMTDEQLPADHAEVSEVVYRNRLVRLCCPRCVKKFNKDPLKYIMELDQKIVEQELPNYPMNDCVVSGKGLDSMGGAVNYVWQNQLVRFCCAPCIKTFNKNPMQYMKKIHEAAQSQKADKEDAKTGG